jgi:branched-chain amino acid aminotransferase
LRVHLDGRLVDEREAVVSVFDRGFLFGDGIFESMRAHQGRIFRMERHLDRLRRSALLIDLRLARKPEALPGAIAELLAANGLEDARVRVTITRGPGRPGDYVGAPGPPTVVIAAQAFQEIDPALRRAGVEVGIPERRQIPPNVLDPAIKSTSRLSSVLARREVAGRGAFEAILLDAEGFLTEGTVSNLFVVAGGRLLTPSLPTGCLPGVTRGAVIELAAGRGLDVTEARLPATVLTTAEEVFLTNTSWEVLPAVRVDGRPVGAGRPGPISREMQERYKDLVISECSHD